MEDKIKIVVYGAKLDDDKKTVKDVELFIEELSQILKLIEEDKITDEEAQTIYEKIRVMLDEHEDEDNYKEEE